MYHAVQTNGTYGLSIGNTSPAIQFSTYKIGGGSTQLAGQAGNNR